MEACPTFEHYFNNSTPVMGVHRIFGICFLIPKVSAIVSVHQTYYRSRNMIEKTGFFWTLSGVVKPSRSIGFRCRVSGFRLALTFSLLTPDT